MIAPILGREPPPRRGARHHGPGHSHVVGQAEERRSRHGPGSRRSPTRDRPADRGARPPTMGAPRGRGRGGTAPVPAGARRSRRAPRRDAAGSPPRRDRARAAPRRSPRAHGSPGERSTSGKRSRAMSRIERALASGFCPRPRSGWYLHRTYDAACSGVPRRVSGRNGRAPRRNRSTARWGSVTNRTSTAWSAVHPGGTACAGGSPENPRATGTRSGSRPAMAAITRSRAVIPAVPGKR